MTGGETESPRTLSSSGPSSAARDSDSGSLPRSTNLDAQFVKGAGPVPGQVLFDRYLVERKLGEGGMGTVWLVRHLEFDSPRALKLIVSGIALDEHTRARFKREARIMDRLNHPNVVRVYNASLGKETAFIEMEYVQGHSLNTVLKPGVPMPLPEVVNLLDQFCDVLQAANDQGIIHRDLKPSNLIVVNGPRPGQRTLKLLDFGIAKIRSGEAEDAITRTGLFLGTPLYSSPEQIQGGKVDSRSDLYSLGVLLYELLTGYRPFTGSLTALICCHTTVPPPPFRAMNPQVQVPDAVEQVVMACLAKNPADRPQSPRQLAEMFHQALGSADIPVYEPAQKTVSIAGGSHLAPTWPMDIDTSTTHPDFEERDAPLDATVMPKTLANTVQTPPAPVSKLRIAGLALAFLVFVGLAAAVAGFAWRSSAGGPKGTGLEAGAGRESTAKDPVPGGPEAERIKASLDYWASKDLKPDPSDKPGQWPQILWSTEGIKYLRGEAGLYIPEGYYAAGGVDPNDGRPAKLIRKDGTEFLRIAGDRFVMGDYEGISQPGDFSRPAHKVSLSGFYMQTTEVTNDEFDRFLSDRTDLCPDWRRTFIKLVDKFGDPQARKYPVTDVPYNVAQAFATRRGGRLPTEAQWEFASRSRGQRYDRVWDHDGTLENLANSQIANLFTVGPSDVLTAPVKSYPKDITAQGVMDMAGNIRELCRDEWRPYDELAPERDPEFPPPFKNRTGFQTVVRGGSYLTDPSYARTTDRREPLDWNKTKEDIGFRLVIECPEERPASR